MASADRGAVFSGGLTTTAIAVTLLAVLPFAAMSVRTGSVAIALYSVTAWNVYAAGLWPGVFRRRLDPARWIESEIIRDAAIPDGRTATG